LRRRGTVEPPQAAKSGSGGTRAASGWPVRHSNSAVKSLAQPFFKIAEHADVDLIDAKQIRFTIRWGLAGRVPGRRAAIAAVGRAQDMNPLRRLHEISRPEH
jgi:hypothetical protein